MDNHQRFIFEAIDSLVQERLKQLKYNYVVEGKITEVISPTTFKVEIDDFEHIIKSINEITYVLDDIVYILIMNNDFSNKFILCKRP